MHWKIKISSFDRPINWRPEHTMDNKIEFDSKFSATKIQMLIQKSFTVCIETWYEGHLKHTLEKNSERKFKKVLRGSLKPDNLIICDFNPNSKADSKGFYGVHWNLIWSGAKCANPGSCVRLCEEGSSSLILASAKNKLAKLGENWRKIGVGLCRSEGSC